MCESEQRQAGTSEELQARFYYAKNGEEIARSSESYVNRSDCRHSITLLQNSSHDEVYYTE